MKAILLVRVSTQVQDLNQQRQVVYNEAIKDGYTPDNIIVIEDKESASRLSEEERNGLNKLKEYIANDNISCIYTYEISRISRRAAVVYSIRDLLIKNNIQLVVVNPYCRLLNADGTISETSNILFGIFATMAENETMIRKARTERGIAKLQAEGKHARCKPLFGYTVNKDKYYIPHPENAEIVKLIFRLYTRGISIRKIAIELHERGIFGKVTFSDLLQRVWKILKNENYAGNNTYPAIISKDEYKATCEIRNENKIEYITTKIYLCKGILRDKQTGQLLSPKKTLNRYSTLNLNRSEAFKQVSISFDIIEPLILEYAITLHKQYTKTFTENDKLRIQHDIDVMNTKICSLNEKLSNIDNVLDRIEERYILGNISKDKADSLRNIQINERTDILTKIKTYKDRIIQLTTMIDDCAEKNIIDYDNLTIEEQLRIIKEVVNVVYISKPNRGRAIIEIHNNYNDEVTKRIFVTHGNRTREITNV